MNITIQQQPTPDYGEPWKQIKHRRMQPVYDRHNKPILASYCDRYVSCVNACAGMVDPEAEIKAMREAINEAHTMLNYALRLNAASSIHLLIDSALTKLQPFITRS